jgi:hypothetical protein
LTTLPAYPYNTVAFLDSSIRQSGRLLTARFQVRVLVEEPTKSHHPLATPAGGWLIRKKERSSPHARQRTRRGGATENTEKRKIEAERRGEDIAPKLSFMEKKRSENPG